MLLHVHELDRSQPLSLPFEWFLNQPSSSYLWFKTLQPHHGQVPAINLA
jgi:hypothetical protein